MNEVLFPALPGPDGAPPRPSSLPQTAMDQSTIFAPKHWRVYKQLIRTNNDIERWHNALNRRAGGQNALPLYLIIELLEREARLTSVIEMFKEMCWVSANSRKNAK